MPIFIDITNQRFGRLTAIRRAGYGPNQHIQWLCRCNCGTEKIIAGSHLRGGLIQSCGCFLRERRSAGNIRHGHARIGKRSKMFQAWCGMRARCTNPRNKFWKSYGGRGIQVCERWQGPDGFSNFLADMGERPERMTLDRINNDGDYTPSNCRWATQHEQRMNQRPRSK